MSGFRSGYLFGSFALLCSAPAFAQSEGQTGSYEPASPSAPTSEPRYFREAPVPQSAPALTPIKTISTEEIALRSAMINRISQKSNNVRALVADVAKLNAQLGNSSATQLPAVSGNKSLEASRSMSWGMSLDSLRALLQQLIDAEVALSARKAALSKELAKRGKR